MLLPFSVNWDEWNQKFPGFILLRVCRLWNIFFQNFAESRAPVAVMMIHMVPSVLLRLFAAFRKKIQMSHENSYVGRSCKTLYESVKKKRKTEYRCEYSVKLKCSKVPKNV